MTPECWRPGSCLRTPCKFPLAVSLPNDQCLVWLWWAARAADARRSDNRTTRQNHALANDRMQGLCVQAAMGYALEVCLPSGPFVVGTPSRSHH